MNSGIASTDKKEDFYCHRLFMAVDLSYSIPNQATTHISTKPVRIKFQANQNFVVVPSVVLNAFLELASAIVQRMQATFCKTTCRKRSASNRYV
jgi:hypothetical protein